MQILSGASQFDPILAASVAHYAAAGVAGNTQRTYRSAWRCFESWCSNRHLQALPAAPYTCAAYLADRAGELRPSSLSVHLAAIAQAHAAAGVPSPTGSGDVAAVLKGVRRAHGSAPVKKAVVTPIQLRTLVLGLSSSTKDLRDRALLLAGFCGGFRRSELVGLDVRDVRFGSEGILVTLRSSKTDQEGQGRVVAIEYGVRPETCAGAAIEAWIALSGVNDGPLFRSVTRHGRVGTRRLNGRAVARVLQGRARAAAIPAENLGGHSLRSGLATAAALAKVDERDIAERTGHKNLGVLRGYIQRVDPFAVSLTQRLGF